MIHINNVSKSFKDLNVLSNISLSLETDKITAFLAPNGEGKTTLLNIISGAILPTSGVVEYNCDFTLSFMSESEKFHSNYRVYDILIQQAILYGKSISEIWNHSAVTVFKLESLKKKPCNELSKGLKQKVSITKALITEADYVIMDEPFDGLDVIARDHLIKLLIDRKLKGKGALITTHIIHDIESFCDSVILIKDQRILNEVYLSKGINSNNLDSKKKSILNIESLYKKTYG